MFLHRSRGLQNKLRILRDRRVLHEELEYPEQGSFSLAFSPVLPPSASGAGMRRLFTHLPLRPPLRPSLPGAAFPPTSPPQTNPRNRILPPSPSQHRHLHPRRIPRQNPPAALRQLHRPHRPRRKPRRRPPLRRPSSPSLSRRSSPTSSSPPTHSPTHFPSSPPMPPTRSETAASDRSSTVGQTSRGSFSATPKTTLSLSRGVAAVAQKMRQWRKRTRSIR